MNPPTDRCAPETERASIAADESSGDPGKHAIPSDPATCHRENGLFASAPVFERFYLELRIPSILDGAEAILKNVERAVHLVACDGQWRSERENVTHRQFET